VLGALIFADPLHITVVAGGLCILVSLIGVSGLLTDWRKRKKTAP